MAYRDYLNGAHPLTTVGIDSATNASAGAYVLTNLVGGQYYVKRIGRSDNDLNCRLKDYVGKYTHFFHVHVSSKEAAYHAECEFYHYWNPSDNYIHPDKPYSSSSCPVSGCSN